MRKTDEYTTNKETIDGMKEVEDRKREGKEKNGVKEGQTRPFRKHNIIYIASAVR